MPLYGCVRMTPGSAFNLDEMLKSVDEHLDTKLKRLYGFDRSYMNFTRMGRVDFGNVDHITYTVGAAAMYMVEIGAICLAWALHVFRSRIPRFRNKHNHPGVALQFLGLLALLVASIIITIAVHRASKLVDKADSLKRVGEPLITLAWCASFPQLIGGLFYLLSEMLWARLKNPELYAEEPPRPTAAIQQRATNRLDPDVDLELPPYSPNDPMGPLPDINGRTPAPRASTDSIELHDIAMDGSRPQENCRTPHDLPQPPTYSESDDSSRGRSVNEGPRNGRRTP
jgi:hypothetical protein